VITVANGQLQVAGGTGVDGQTLLNFIEQVELGGTTMMEHGDVVFNAASDGVIGGCMRARSRSGIVWPASGYASVAIAIFRRWFKARPRVGVGHYAGHHTCLRQCCIRRDVSDGAVFHSSLYPSGSPRGAEQSVRCASCTGSTGYRSANPATQVAPATVLFDGVIANARAFARMRSSMLQIQCSLAFTYVWLPVDALVRGTLPGTIR